MKMQPSSDVLLSLVRAGGAAQPSGFAYPHVPSAQAKSHVKRRSNDSMEALAVKQWGRRNDEVLFHGDERSPFYGIRPLR
jgi:hypothetical protein